MQFATPFDPDWHMAETRESEELAPEQWHITLHG